MDKRRPAHPLMVFMLFFALSLAYTWPLANHFLEAIPFGYDADPGYALARLFMGDHLQYYYHLGLMYHAAVGDIAWFTNPLEFATPYQPDWFFSYSLPVAIIYLPFAFISMPLAYNVFLLTTLALGGLCMYLWAYDKTGDRFAAVAAGVAFNFLPNRLVEILGGHPSGMIVFLVPLTLYLMDRAIDRGSFKYSIGAGVSGFVLAFQYNYFAYYFLMLLMAYLPWRLAGAVITAKYRGETVKDLLFAGLPFAIGMLGAIGWMMSYKATIVEKTALGAGRTMGEVALFSPPLDGAWDTDKTWAVYLGVAGVAAMVALLWAVVAKRPGRWDALFFGGVLLVAYALAFGVSLNDHLPLYQLFYDRFPYFSFSRNPTKIMILAMTALGLLVGYLVAWLNASRKEGTTILAAALVAVIAIDDHPKKMVGLCMLDEGNKAYEYLARQKPPAPVVNIPIWPGEASWEAIYQYYTVQSGVPMVNGYSPLVIPDYVDNVFWPLFPMNSGDLGPEQAKVLAGLGVRRVVFHADAFPPKVSAYSPYFTLRRLADSPYLKLVYQADPIWVFSFDKEATYVADRPRIAPRTGLLYEAEAQVRIKGIAKEEPTAGNGWALRGDGKPGEILNAGPYATLPSGDYRLTAYVKVDGGETLAPDTPVVRFDIAADEGRKILADVTVAAGDVKGPGYHPVTIPFALAEGGRWQVEFRAYQGEAPLWVDAYYLLPANETDPSYRYEAERLNYYSGRLIEETGGVEAIRSSRPDNPADVMIFGPDRFLPAGGYDLRIRYRVEGSDATAMRVIVRDVQREKSMAEKIVSNDPRIPVGEWGTLSIPVTLNNEALVDVRVIFGGGPPVAVDWIEFTPR